MRRKPNVNLIQPTPQIAYDVVDEATGTVLPLGAKIKDFRGDPATLVGYSAPRHEGSSGRVTVRLKGGFETQYYPGVFSLKLVPKEKA